MSWDVVTEIKATVVRSATKLYIIKHRGNLKLYARIVSAVEKGGAGVIKVTMDLMREGLSFGEGT